MVAYILPADTNRAAIGDGRRWLMLAAPRRPETANQHPGTGARLHLRTAQTNDRNSHYFPEVRCCLSGVVTFSADGVVRVIEAGRIAETRRDGEDAARRSEGLANLLTQAEQGSAGDRAAAADKIAVAAGFKDYAALWASIRRNEGEVIARHLLAWVSQ